MCAALLFGEATGCEEDANGLKNGICGIDVVHTHLSDGVQGRLRYDLSSGAPVAQFRVANRDFPLPREHDLGEASKRVIRQFQKPNRHPKRDSAASAKIRSLTTLYNVKAARAPDSRNNAEAVLLGYCPVEVWRPHWVAGGARRVPGAVADDIWVTVDLMYIMHACGWTSSIRCALPCELPCELSRIFP